MVEVFVENITKQYWNWENFR